MNIIFRNLLLLLFLGVASSAMAQRDAEQGLDSATGKIDAINQDDKFIVIDGKRLVFQDANVVVNYNGQPINSVVLEPGQSIRYRTRQDGSVSFINLTTRLQLEQLPGNN